MTTAAEALGISPRELATDLQAGQSIAEVASEQGVEIEAVPRPPRCRVSPAGGSVGSVRHANVAT